MSNILKRECKFVLYAPPNELNIEDDIHIVKELITYEDGKKEPRLSYIKNFQKPFYVTKEFYRNHKDKKESEDLEKVDIFKATNKNMPKAVASRLGSQYIGTKTMRDVCDSPYLYGTDIDSKAIIKKMFMDKYPNNITSFKVAALDIETNLETDEIVIISIATSEEVYVGILSSIIPNKNKIEEQLLYLYKNNIPQTEFNKNIKPVFELFEHESELICNVLARLHSYKVDICAIWNMDYDIPYIIKRCKKFNIELKDIFSDPSVPKEYRYFVYKQGKKVKVKESGQQVPINPNEQWHTINTPSYHYWLDAMSTYYFVRVGSKQVPGGYSLDNILEKELGDKLKKLKFKDDETTHLLGVDWHKFMLQNRPLQYIIYNAWDTMSILELDNKTKDMCNSIGILSGISSFDIFDSGPKKIVDALHYFYLQNNRVLGVKGTKDTGDLLGMGDWINILDNDFIEDSESDAILEDSNIDTGIRANILDLDAVSSYPSDTQAANVSKDTTSREIIDIIGIARSDYMLYNIDLFFGNVNAIEYCQNMLNFPSLYRLEHLIKNPQDLELDEIILNEKF